MFGEIFRTFSIFSLNMINFARKSQIFLQLLKNSSGSWDLFDSFGHRFHANNFLPPTLLWKYSLKHLTIVRHTLGLLLEVFDTFCDFFLLFLRSRFLKLFIFSSEWNIKQNYAHIRVDNAAWNENGNMLRRVPNHYGNWLLTNRIGKFSLINFSYFPK